ncbi:related to mutanase (glucan endo-1,3-alpha-glucosidase) [Phialocephala subalpina]|uniref:Related to mutanase (Glucan endo-1,3-alpha-glucosidase) n=1 Tax=Phialocephala subalpina TaxID=576137 RepID=A0A1L7WQY6_9HELO|nr:related to mutanase (glucan endo-1,3-alpha-glucosidase) [Phialocephala subalpina]
MRSFFSILGALSALSSTFANAATIGKPVFFHYLIGTVYDEHCQQDILDARALGADAFALNIANDDAAWSLNTTSYLFKWANEYNFKLFFSFDMTGFSNPDQFTDFLLSYVTNDAYYTYNGLPFVSTFNGGASTYKFGQDSVNDGWKVALQDVMSNAGHPIYFIPAFQDTTALPDYFTNDFPTLDGAMNWNSWPFASQGDIIVPTTDDQTYLTAAHASSKTFMMGVSPLQFKHIDSSQNWYRRGEQNLEYRFGQVLSLQPDFVELQTWNDAGESHYMGNSWPEPIAGTVEGAYTDSYDHTGYQQILPAFIKAFKAGATNTDTMFPTNGANAQGVFWHHTLLANADCSADGLGKPSGIETVEDKVTAVVLVAEGVTTYNVSIFSNTDTLLGTTKLVPGYNAYSVAGLDTGTVVVSVEDTSSGSEVVKGTGPIAVSASVPICLETMA